MENEKPFEKSFESLEELADTISEVLRGSVTIEDANHKLVAYSSHQAQTDAARVSTIIGKRVPEKVIQTLWRDGIIPKLMKSDEPVVIPAINEIGLGDRVAIAIRKDAYILGYIWVVWAEGELPKNRMMELLKNAAKAAKTKLLQLQSKHRKAEQSYREFFRQLLAGDMKSDYEVKQFANQLGLQLPPCYCVNVIQFPSEITDKWQQQMGYLLATDPQHRVPVCISNNDQFILLEALSSKAATTQPLLVSWLMEQMTQRFGVVPSYGGSGSVYESYVRVERSYQEALTVIRMKQSFLEEMNSVHHYAGLGFYRLLPAIIKENQEHAYENECLQKIEAYDLEHNGELLRTLEVYLSNDSRLKDSADVLCIHENTLSYRLKRITAIGGIDLNNMHQKVTCYLELKAKQFNNQRG